MYCYFWLADITLHFYSDNLVSFHTGLISRPGNDTINPEQVEDIGLKLQKDLDGGKYKDVMSTMIKVKPLSDLIKTVKKYKTRHWSSTVSNSLIDL